MATAGRERPSVVVGDAREVARFKYMGEAFAGNAVRALWAAGLLFLIGSLADLVLLWGMQRRADDPLWEFGALQNTIEGTPRIVLAVAMIWVALHIRGSTSLVTHRLLASIILLLGLVGAAIGAMMVTDYFVLRGNVQGPDQRIFASAVLKALTLSGLHLVVLVPVGVMGMRRPRG